MAHVELPEIADAIREWFPEVEGRVFATLGGDITQENMPKLPLIAVATGAISVKSHNYTAKQNSIIEAIDEFQIDFWLQPKRHKRKDGTETPFWSYYSIHSLMKKLIVKLIEFGNEKEAFFEFGGLAVEPTELALILSFQFRQNYRICPNEFINNQGVQNFQIATSVKQI